MEITENSKTLKFDANGLIPAIVQDHYTKEVLTLAYMNAARGFPARGRFWECCGPHMCGPYRVDAWRRGDHTRISTPFSRKYRFKSLISTCFVWKIDAARPASTAG